jgi:hypothetical protein
MLLQQTPTIPQGVAALLPFAATMISSWLSHLKLPNWANALIALVFLVGTAVGSLFLAGNITGNLQASILLVLGYVFVLMNGDLKTLTQFLLYAPSPLAALVPITPTAPSSVVVPQPAVVTPALPQPLSVAAMNTMPVVAITSSAPTTTTTTAAASTEHGG